MTWNRRCGTAALAIALTLVSSACKRHHRQDASSTAADNGGSTAASVVNANDPREAPQFVRGFYGIEGESWRWTEKTFAVSLGPPRGAAQKGAQLVLQFAIPEDTLRKRPSLTIAATVGGLKLAPETYTQAGELRYTRDIPADRLTGDTALFEFTLDKALPPNPPDARELGIIVSQAGLQTK